ncbi:hypothetical protein Taro_018139 [Colocasia esculenta]|uniref:Uncharacterized protein n=1 Tax=Colocasia esculenta TaxID=4460 RepID=A0A843V1K3_COLES|nr:hypothetical protein [Colocasia esculenta]
MAAVYGFPAAGRCGSGEVAGHAPAKTKRKDLDEVYDEFAEFSLSSPARKIRRLDAELTPLMEKVEELAIPHVFGQPLPEEQLQSSSQEMAVGSLNEERAIVLYKPVHAPLVDFSPSSDVFLRVDPDVMAGFKNRGFWSGQSSKVEIRELEEEAPTHDGKPASRSCLAVVPWVPSRPAVGAAFPAGATGGASELAEEEMVAEDMGDASMDVEEEAGRPAVAAAAPGDGMVVTHGFQHWQQHCMMPQISPSNSTPITWSWG